MTRVFFRYRGVFRMAEIQQERPIILLISADRRCFIVSQRTTDANIAALPHTQNPQCLQMSPLSRSFFSPPYIQATQTRLPHEFQRQSVIVVSTFPPLHPKSSLTTVRSPSARFEGAAVALAVVVVAVACIDWEDGCLVSMSCQLGMHVLKGM